MASLLQSIALLMGPDLGEDAAQDGTDRVEDSVGRVVLVQTSCSGSETAARRQVHAQARSGKQAKGCVAGFPGHCQCSAHRCSVEGAAQGVWHNEAERELFQAILEMLGLHGSLMRPQQPWLQQREDAMDPAGASPTLVGKYGSESPGFSLETTALGFQFAATGGRFPGIRFQNGDSG
jgi:hypothetical protein